MSVIPGIVETRFRDHVLAGKPPEGVASINRTVSPQDLAVSVVNGLMKGRNTVVNPRIGWVFWGLDVFLPRLMHGYLRRRWAVPKPV